MPATGLVSHSRRGFGCDPKFGYRDGQAVLLGLTRAISSMAPSFARAPVASEVELQALTGKVHPPTMAPSFARAHVASEIELQALTAKVHSPTIPFAKATVASEVGLQALTREEQHSSCCQAEPRIHARPPRSSSGRHGFAVREMPYLPAQWMVI